MKRYIRPSSVENRKDSQHSQKVAAAADHYIRKYKKAMKVLAR